MQLSRTRADSIQGCLLGTAMGDALGLPFEGLSRRKVLSRGGPLRHRLVFGCGMFSDDTEHSLMVANVLTTHLNDAVKFQRALSKSLRWWLAALPAGVGLSTAKAIFKLWLGFPPARSGVRSAGNGAAMRSAIIGVAFANDEGMRREFTKASCVLTHTDPRAEESAQLVAGAASLAANSIDSLAAIARLESLVSSDEMKVRFARLKSGLENDVSVADFAQEIGCEKTVSGFAPNTVSVAIFSWLRHRDDFRKTISAVIECGGDTDTVAAIAGGICGAECGENGIPDEWMNGICDWPRSVTYIKQVAMALDQRIEGGAPSVPALFWPAIPIRNAIFLIIVLSHGFRRLIP